MKVGHYELFYLADGLAPSTDDIEDLLSLARYAKCYANARGNNITKSMWKDMKVGHYELLYLADSFAVQNFTERIPQCRIAHNVPPSFHSILNL